MKTPLRKRSLLLASVLLMIGSVYLACFLWVRKEQRQHTLNRQLIEAWKKADVGQAKFLVEEGADPNECFDPTPAPTLKDLVKRLLHRSSPPMNNSPTAFIMASGRYWGDDRDGYHRCNVGDTELVKVMLLHGAKVNEDKDGGTALICASCDKDMHDTTTIMLLLDHGADINHQEMIGMTALMAAVILDHTEAVKLLLKYHANPYLKTNINGKSFTALNFTTQPDIIRLLKQAGATE